MNWDQIAGTWKELTGKARARWGEITDDEWMQAKGDRDQMVGLIQRRYGKAKEVVEREIDDWRAGL
jgi:uncharacterized protein YjbJ (UPF0337 family)